MKSATVSAASVRTTKIELRLLLRDRQAVRAVVAAERAERVLLDEIEDRHRALVVGVRRDARQRRLVEQHFIEPLSRRRGAVRRSSRLIRD